METPTNKSTILNSERGSILLISLVLLVVMGIFGSILTSTTITEQKISGNYRSSQESFYAADRALEYVTEVTSSSDEEFDLYTSTHLSYLELGDSGIEDPDESMEEDANQVIYISNGAPATGSGYSVDEFEARNYRATIVGVFPVTAENPSRTILRSHYQKLITKSD
jgi:hypothetical protein